MSGEPLGSTRLVYKGWWVMAERPVRQEVLVRHAALKRRLKGRPWWRGLSKRWQRS